MNQYLVDRIQNIPAEQVKEAVISWLATSEAELNNLEQHLGLDTSNTSQPLKRTKDERLQAFRDWIESHRGQNLPILSDEAISRESMYPDRW